MKKRVMTAMLGAVLAACGGGADGGGDGDDDVFPVPSYPDPVPASPSQTMVLQSWLPTAVGLPDAPSAAAALALASTTTLTSRLLGPSPLGFAAASAEPEARLPAAGVGGDCVTVTATGIAFDHCESSLGGGITTITDGEVNVNADAGAVSWDLDITSVIATQGLTSEARYHQSGDLTIAGGSIRGEMLAELGATATSGQYTFDYAMSERVRLDLVFQASPACVLSGTLEAQRVWTKRPEGYPPESTPDGAVLIEWSGCGEATIATWTEG